MRGPGPGVCLVNIPSLPLGSLPLLTKQFWSNLFSFCSWDFVRGQIPGWGRINKIAWLMIGESAWNAIYHRISVKETLSPPGLFTGRLLKQEGGSRLCRWLPGIIFLCLLLRNRGACYELKILCLSLLYM